MTPSKLKLTMRLDGFVKCISTVKLILVQVQNAPHEAKLSHELIAAAASFEVRVLIYIVSHLPINNDTLSIMHRLPRHTMNTATVRVSHKVMRQLKRSCKLLLL